MSVMKLLSRTVAPDLATANSDTEEAATTETEEAVTTETEEALHDHTYGITLVLMTQFDVVLSALIYDVDHPGVPNSQLIDEKSSLAAVYRNKSIAEQTELGRFGLGFVDGRCLQCSSSYNLCD